MNSGVEQLILRHAESEPARIALIAPTAKREYGATNYADLASRVAAAAAGFSARGVRRGDRVVVLVTMSTDLYVVLLAIVSLGATAVFVEPASTPKEMARVIRVVRPVGFIGIPKAHVLRFIEPALGKVPMVVSVGDTLAARLTFAEPLSAIEAAHRGAALPPSNNAADDPALLTFSSGSTGVPKGATRSHAFLTAQHHAIEGLLDRQVGQQDVDLSAFAIVLLSTLAAGHTAMIPRMGRRGVDDIDGGALARAIADHGVTVISGSPAFLAPIFAEDKSHLAGVRRIVSGGAPVPVSMCRDAKKALGRRGSFLVVYGSTEAEPIATIDATEVCDDTGTRTEAGAGLCVGRPDSHVSVALIRPTTEPLLIGPGGMVALSVAQGEVGEVVVAGDHVNKTYYRNKAAERATKLVDETGTIWHRTGDAAYADDRGRLWLVGRVADIVVRQGATYHPAAVEAAAKRLAFVDRAALINRGGNGPVNSQSHRRANRNSGGGDHGESDETLLLVQQHGRAGRLASLNPLRGARARELTEAMAKAGVIVDEVRFVNELPVDPRHRAKLDYPAIRRRYGNPRT